MKNYHNNENDFSLLACSEVQQICENLFMHMPYVKAFQYSRIYPDGSRTELSNHFEFLHDTFVISKRINRLYTPGFMPKNINYALLNELVKTLPAGPKKIIEEQLCQEHVLFGLGNELEIFKRHPQYLEIFHFLGDSKNTWIYQLYVDNLDLLKQFTLYFVQTAQSLIKEADNNRLVPPWRTADITAIEDHSSPFNIDRSTFLKSIIPDRIVLPSDYGEITITKRELQCLRLLATGKTNRGIAKVLCISARTVETHLNSLRLKTGSLSRSHLIDLFLGSDWASSLSLLEDLR